MVRKRGSTIRVKRRGGNRVLGVGVNGCVVTPLDGVCTPPFGNEDSVKKIYDQEYLLEGEYALNKVLRDRFEEVFRSEPRLRVDRFFMPILKKCVGVDSDIGQNVKDMCKFGPTKKHRLSVGTMRKFDGVAFSVAEKRGYFRDVGTFNIVAMNLVLEGAILDALGIIHNDLHWGNVLLGVSGENAYVPRIIDFGRSFDIDDDSNANVLEIERQYKLLPFVADFDRAIGYLQYSPEFATMSLMMEYNEYVGYSYKFAPDEVDIFAMRFLEPRARLHPNLSRSGYKRDMRELYASLSEFLSQEAYPYHSMVSAYRDKQNSWSIGYILARTAYYNNIYDSKTLAEGEKLMRAVIATMSDINPDRRISCLDALRLLEPAFGHMIIVEGMRISDIVEILHNRVFGNSDSE